MRSTTSFAWVLSSVLCSSTFSPTFSLLISKSTRGNRFFHALPTICTTTNLNTMPVRKNSNKAKKATNGTGETSPSSLSRTMEKSLTEGYENVIGLDEAGRGPLAGPVVAAACFIPAHLDLIPGIQDSKLLNEAAREAAYEVLVHHPEVKYSYCVVDHLEIDEVNILQASMNAMSRSTVSLLTNSGLLNQPNGNKTSEGSATKAKKAKAPAAAPKSELKLESFIALVDGNRIPADLPIPGKFVIQGDRKIYSIAAASIIAKVVRDRLMVELDKEFPVYNFAKHKGYPTFEHRSLLMKHGPCKYHRKTYAPVKNAIEAHAAKEQRANKAKETSDEGTTDTTAIAGKKRNSNKAKQEKDEKEVKSEPMQAVERKKSRGGKKAAEATVDSNAKTTDVAAEEAPKRGRKRKAAEAVVEEPEAVAVVTAVAKRGRKAAAEAVSEVVHVETAPTSTKKVAKKDAVNQKTTAKKAKGTIAADTAVRKSSRKAT